MSCISKVMGHKDSFNSYGHSEPILMVLFISIHCLEKRELKIEN